jgi:hypothetical protein
MAYLLLGSPLLLFIYLRFDPVVVALAVWGAAMARRRYESAAGIGLGAASLMKVWPVVIVPALLFSPKKKAILATVVVWLVGSASWILLTSRSAASQVLSFRGATGWGAESPVGTLVWLITGGPTRLENGAPRVGVVPPWATTVLAIALVATVTAIWVRARGRRVDSFGTPALGAMGALLTFSPLFSLQYVGWLLPWAAIAHQDGDHRAMPVTMMVSVATASLFVLYAADQLAWAQVLLIIRAVAVGGLAVSALRRDVAPGAERATG